jgi:hypothetical protein
MFFLPKSDDLEWTQHSLAKLRQYRLSASRIKRVLRHPDRLEVGIAANTIAAMQKAGSARHPYEIWVMYAQKKQNSKHKFQKPAKIRIISVWRYPGISPVHEPPPIPQEVWDILAKSGHH